MRPVLRFLLPVALVAAMAVPAGAAVAAPAQVDRTLDSYFIFTRCDPNTEVIQGTSISHVVSKENKDGSFTQRIQSHIRATGDQGHTWVSNATFVIITQGVDFEIDTHAVMIGQGSLPNEVYKSHFSTNPFEETVTSDCRG